MVRRWGICLHQGNLLEGTASKEKCKEWGFWPRYKNGNWRPGRSWAALYLFCKWAEHHSFVANQIASAEDPTSGPVKELVVWGMRDAGVNIHASIVDACDIDTFRSMTESSSETMPALLPLSVRHFKTSTEDLSTLHTGSRLRHWPHRPAVAHRSYARLEGPSPKICLHPSRS